MLQKKGIVEIKGLKFSNNLLGIENVIEGNHKKLYESVRGVINEITSIGYNTYRSISYLQFINNKDFNELYEIFKEFYEIKGEHYNLNMKL